MIQLFHQTAHQQSTLAFGAGTTCAKTVLDKSQPKPCHPGRRKPIRDLVTQRRMCASGSPLFADASAEITRFVWNKVSPRQSKTRSAFAIPHAKADRQTVYKPGFVQGGEPSGRPFIWDPVRTGPRATYPDTPTRKPAVTGQARLHGVPIRSCSWWGLPCLLPYGRSGGLLPHRFTLTRLIETIGAVYSLWRYP